MAGLAEPATLARARVDGHERQELDSGWEVASAGRGSKSPPDTAALDWIPARVPGTVAAALREAGVPEPGPLDDADWWFRTRFGAAPVAADEEVVLALDGIATLADVHLNGVPVLESHSMFAPHRVLVGSLLGEDNELLIACRALTPQLADARRPRARWRTRVAHANLRFQRTALLGRAPGFAPGPAPVGPWRGVRIERRRGLAVEALELRPRTTGADAVLAVRALLRPLDGEPVTGAEVTLSGPSGEHGAPLAAIPVDGGVRLEGELTVPAAERWWPHTHGAPALHTVTLRVQRPAGDVGIAAGRVGFRALAPGHHTEHDIEVDGLDLHLNGVRVFARGAVWTPADPIGLAPTAAELRAQLERVRDAGMNLLRVPGVGVYEDGAFGDLCDELGILVWQDLMFANFDYPLADPDFRALVEAEARQVLNGLAGRPSTAVVCGGSEVEQQAAMFGADHRLARTEPFAETFPALVAQAGAIWVPSAPCGGDLPFRPGVGIANYYGVGAYGLPLEDARRSGVRFAAECLAFANVPDDDGAGPFVPRDAGAAWDFADVRDRYLEMLFAHDPAELRLSDPERYLALSRQVTGEVMAEVFGEWRRDASPCGGGLVLWLRDLEPGAGWGVLDHRGQPKVAWHHLRRALAPVAVWTTDEQLNGIAIHVANDGPQPLRARLRVTLYADGERRVDEAVEALELPAATTLARDAEGILGHFVDASWAYRFGPAAHDVVVASLEREGPSGVELLSQAMRFVTGRPRERLDAEALGLRAALAGEDGDGTFTLTVSARRLVYGLRIAAGGWLADDDAFNLEPGASRMVRLRPAGAGQPQSQPPLTLSALNLAGSLTVGAPQ